MRKMILLLVIIALLLPFSMAAAQDEVDCDIILLLDTRARASVATTGATYLTLVNLTEENVAFTGGQTDRAEAVEIHTMNVDEDDVMAMMPLPDGLIIPSGEAAEFAPGGLHVMLIGLDDFFEAGDEFDLVLTFDDERSIAVPVPILDIDSGMDMDMGDEDMDDMDMDDDPMSHPVSFSGLGECGDLESVWIGDMDMGAMEEEMDMDESYVLSLRLVFEDMSEISYEIPVITAASLMDMEMMEMDG